MYHFHFKPSRHTITSPKRHSTQPSVQISTPHDGQSKRPLDTTVSLNGHSTPPSVQMATQTRQDSAEVVHLALSGFDSQHDCKPSDWLVLGRLGCACHVCHYSDGCWPWDSSASISLWMLKIPRYFCLEQAMVTGTLAKFQIPASMCRSSASVAHTSVMMKPAR